MISHNMDESPIHRQIIVLHNSNDYRPAPAQLFEKNDELVQLGLDLPATVKIKNLLEKCGIKLDTPALDVPSLYTEILKKFGGKS